MTMRGLAERAPGGPRHAQATDPIRTATGTDKKTSQLYREQQQRHTGLLKRWAAGRHAIAAVLGILVLIRFSLAWIDVAILGRVHRDGGHRPPMISLVPGEHPRARRRTRTGSSRSSSRRSSAGEARSRCSSEPPRSRSCSATSGTFAAGDTTAPVKRIGWSATLDPCVAGRASISSVKFPTAHKLK